MDLPYATYLPLGQSLLCQSFAKYLGGERPLVFLKRALGAVLSTMGILIGNTMVERGSMILMETERICGWQRPKLC